MEHLPEFISNHWMLSLALIIVVILIFLNEAQNHFSGAKSVEPFKVVNLINRESAIILDIRSPELFKKEHIINAINTKPDEADQLQKYKQKDVVIVCESGIHSKSFAATLKKSGFEKISILRGGLQAWKQAELPTTH